MTSLVHEPSGMNATEAPCPACGAWQGWSCGPCHADGSHRQRVLAALSARGRTLRRVRNPACIGEPFFLDLRLGSYFDAVPGYRSLFVQREE